MGVEDATAGVQAIKATGMVAIAVGDKADLIQADVVVPATNRLNYPLLAEAFKRYHK
ncbi:hypothetical protein FC36_GL000723 [Ligilactobacillus equi DSM 15833 = JCM 10991]|uniref:Beta-phosphoglucomutase n=1 Tax=Ligilactobacillus equi DSM 15833 = JCM 10991 TaxID=1423740 RepID=A0A0R1TX92_9LACO|nr:hypothetical protein FC36_GL000723 [Ligilactobacillus equi DSM 15833 = JCM 10991]